jgi:putative inorganic carbon (hco3(-)) transporter
MSDRIGEFPASFRQLPSPNGMWRGLAAVRTELILGVLGALGAVLTFCFPWTAGLIVGAVVFVLSAAENEAFLLFVVFLMPFGWILSADTPVRDMHEVFHLIVEAGFFSGRLFRSKLSLRELSLPGVSRASLLFLCVAVVPTLLDRAKLDHYSLRADASLIEYVAFYSVIVTWANSRERVRKIVGLLFTSTIITALLAFYQVVTGGPSSLVSLLYPPSEYSEGWTGRATSLLGAPNSFAGYLNLILPLALAFCLLDTGRSRRLGKWTLWLGVLALLLTQSLGGLCGFIAILILAIIRFVGTPKKKLLILGGLCGLVGLLYLSIHIITPVHTEGQLGADAITRLVLWAAAWNLFRQSPVLGVGWGNFTAVYGLNSAYFISDKVAAHNIYLQLLSETGLIGVCSFIYLVVQSWKQAVRQWQNSGNVMDRAIAFGVQGALISVLVHGMVDFFFQLSVQFGTLFWTLLALLVVSGRLSVTSTDALEKESREGGLVKPQTI